VGTTGISGDGNGVGTVVGTTPGGVSTPHAITAISVAIDADQITKRFLTIADVSKRTTGAEIATFRLRG
jgi:hypothetical protein